MKLILISDLIFYFIFFAGLVLYNFFGGMYIIIRCPNQMKSITIINMVINLSIISLYIKRCRLMMCHALLRLSFNHVLVMGSGSESRAASGKSNSESP